MDEIIKDIKFSVRLSVVTKGTDYQTTIELGTEKFSGESTVERVLRSVGIGDTQEESVNDAMEKLVNYQVTDDLFLLDDDTFSELQGEEFVR